MLAFSFLASSQKNPGLIASGATVVKLAGGFSFTEGPAVDRLGNVYFTDQPNNKIHIWTINGKLETFLENSGRANGLYFDLSGNLLSCSDMDNQLWSISVSDKTHTNLVLNYGDKKLNGPNDLWVHPGGGIFFTDPLYVRPYWTRDPAMQQDGEHVYYLSPDRKTLLRVATDLVKPNGIVGTPDGKTLYVADIGANKTYAYNIRPDGSLANKKLFAELGSDGMTIDNKGNVYLTGDGVTIFNKKGKKIGHIPVDAPWTANVCFGGKEMKTLFITASDGLFALEMKVRGVSK
ncbi:MAG: SMP-30/gluconolactonase/LRE family protein [Bacteroidales bacterium]|nr:SMP-30/gluconolactonase/LRE family protein [Bacteroidales bacterium]